MQFMPKRHSDAIKASTEKKERRYEFGRAQTITLRFFSRVASEQAGAKPKECALPSLGRRVVFFHLSFFLHTGAGVLRTLSLPTRKRRPRHQKERNRHFFFEKGCCLRELCPLRPPNPPQALFSSTISCSRQCLSALCAVMGRCAWSDATRHDISLAHSAVGRTSKLAQEEASANPGRANPASMWLAKSEANMRARCGCPSTAAACAGVANALAMSMRMGPCVLACAA